MRKGVIPLYAAESTTDADANKKAKKGAGGSVASPVPDGNAAGGGVSVRMSTSRRRAFELHNPSTGSVLSAKLGRLGKVGGGA